ncbi:hypothetical protein SCHPADRAFT_996993 [Schizopora paradoxa]|uniref:Uncharacterized protein n=1 Tax=Schizopora paradoxa TaxID=27342 RepID=A0A0H2SAH1_9AGAM|nr:hypothetical protein SCHPADRAFT_996993 [Schizopora paradoxa]
MSTYSTDDSEEKLDIASRMCKSNVEFGKWAKSRGISVDRDEANPDIHPLVVRFGLPFKPPPDFFDELSKTIRQTRERDRPLLEEIRDHYISEEKRSAAALNGDEEKDVFWPSLWLLLAALQQSRKPGLNERTLRQTGDILLLELRLRLRQPLIGTDIISPSDITVRLPYRDKMPLIKRAQYDTALHVEFKDEGPKDAIIRELLSSDFLYRTEALFYHRCSTRLSLEVLLFNVEYKTREDAIDIDPPSASGVEASGDPSTAVIETTTKRDWAFNEMCLHLAVSLFHCKALGFDDMPAFGATIVGNDFRLYVAEWDRLGEEDGKPSRGIKIRFQKRYSLDDGVEICDLFALLSRLFKHLINVLEVQYSQLKPLEELKANLEEFRWRVPDSAASTTRKASSSSISQNGARENEDEEVPSKLTKKYLRSVGSIERSSSERGVDIVSLLCCFTFNEVLAVASWANECLEEEFLDPTNAIEVTDRRSTSPSLSTSDDEG